MRYGLLAAGESAWEKGLKLTVVVALHVLLLDALVSMNVSPQILETLVRFDMRVIENPPHLPVKTEEHTPLPVASRPIVQRRVAPQTVETAPPQPVQQAVPQMVETAPPQPVMTAAGTATGGGSFTVPVQPTQPAIEAKPEQLPRLTPEPVKAPRFDAVYLHNPAPAYPLQSQQMNEEGSVLLSVLVSAQGAALSVQIKQSSGFARLDEAALEAVRQWRFVPAKRGAEPVEGWVVVPIFFRLVE